MTEKPGLPGIPRMLGMHITTLGCKLNQHDSAELAGSLRTAAGPVHDPAAARLIVVNTCTVTGAADADARQILRRRRRESPAALIVATGCYAERSPETLASMPEVDLVLKRADRPRAARIILDALRLRFPDELSDGCADRVVEEGLPDFGDRTRAYLRVQDGCDLRCSYCVIPRVRGESRSLPAEAVESRLRRLLDAGYREVVLTGVNTGEYGRDLDTATDLARLLERLVRLPGDYRLRLNSVEPRCVTPALVDLIASEARIARHLQIPLQSGSDTVLSRMRRNYRTGRYQKIVWSLRNRIPEIALGADVIVGFPGETEEEFGETLRFLESSPLNYLHVFSYSRRPGTPAAVSPDQITPPVIRERSRTLREVGRRLSHAFKSGQVGRLHRALVLHGTHPDGRLRGLTSNFIEVALEGRSTPNSFLDLRIDRVEPDGEAVAFAA